MYNVVEFKMIGHCSINIEQSSSPLFLRLNGKTPETSSHKFPTIAFDIFECLENPQKNFLDAYYIIMRTVYSKI